MTKVNKAQKATANRLTKLYPGTVCESDGGIQIQSDGRLIDIATTASLNEALQRLGDWKLEAYVAVTNQEAIVEALRKTLTTKVGVMDPRGNIVREAGSST